MTLPTNHEIGLSAAKLLPKTERASIWAGVPSVWPFNPIKLFFESPLFF